MPKTMLTKLIDIISTVNEVGYRKKEEKKVEIKEGD